MVIYCLKNVQNILLLPRDNHDKIATTFQNKNSLLSCQFSLAKRRCTITLLHVTKDNDIMAVNDDR